MNRAFICHLLLPACLMASDVPSTVAAENSDLATSAERRDFAGVARQLQKKAAPDSTQPDGMTALHWAVWHDHLGTTRLLLQSGATAEVANRYGLSPLAFACTNGNIEIVRLLLHHGADAKRQLEGGETLVMTAARTGRPEIVKLLLNAGARVDGRDGNGQTALMWAAAEGHAKVIEVLLNAGADHTTTLKSGFNALFFAAREGRTNTVRTLLKAGGDVNSTMTPSRTGGKAPRKGMTALMLALENGHFELAALLLELGADPNDQRSGFAPLHALTWVRKPNRGDGPDGEPAPHGSGKLTSLQLAEKLIAAGADVNLGLKRGRSGRGWLSHVDATPFLMAADTADIEYMRLLLKLGADPTIPNSDNCTALLAAAGIGTRAPGEEAGTEEEAIAAVRMLLDLGLDINHKDDNGETAMHGAAYKSLPLMVKFLADHGADIGTWHQKNDYGWTPLLIAQGHRPGNFKPAPATITALEGVMRAGGVTPEQPEAYRGGDEYNRTPKRKTTQR